MGKKSREKDEKKEGEDVKRIGISSTKTLLFFSFCLPVIPRNPVDSLTKVLGPGLVWPS